MSIFTSFWQSIFLLTYGAWVRSCCLECGYWGVYVCLNLSVCFDGSACSLDTDTQSTWWPVYLLLKCHVCCVYWLVNWANSTPTKALVSLPAPCNCSPQAVPYHGHLPCSKNMQLGSCGTEGPLREQWGVKSLHSHTNLQLNAICILEAL